MSDLATGEFHYSNLAVEAVEGDTHTPKKTRKLPASILRSEAFNVTCVEAANNTYIAAGCDSGDIHIVKSWGAPHRDLLGGEGEIISMHFSSDDKKIIAGTSFGLVFIWDLDSDSDYYIERISGHIGGVNTVKFSPDGSSIAAGDGVGNIYIYNSLMQLQFTNSDHTDSVNGLVFTSDGSHIVSASSDGSIKVINVSTGLLHYDHIADMHVGAINSIDLTSVTIGAVTGDIIATGGDDLNIRCAEWDEGGAFPSILSGKKPGHADPVISVRFEHLTLQRRIMSCDGERIKIWELNSAVPEYSNTDELSDAETKPKFLTVFGPFTYTCDGKTKKISQWSFGKVIDIEIFKTIIQVVVWPDPDTFNIPQPSWPVGPIASAYPITCYAKRVGIISDMDWKGDFENLSIEDIQIRGYYTNGFSESFLSDGSGDSE
jgi:WD40 repeat protein